MLVDVHRYEIGTIMRRTSEVFSNNLIEVKLDNIEGMDKTFVQVQGKVGAGGCWWVNIRPAKRHSLHQMC